MPSRVRSFDDDLGVFGLPGDVSPWDIRFDPSDRACLEPLDEGRFRFRVWTEPSLTEAMVVIRIGTVVTGHPLAVSARTERFAFFEAMLGPWESGGDPVEFSLAFRTSDDRPVYFVAAGVTGAVERLDRWVLDQTMPPVALPGWAQGAVMYQIFPDRFCIGAQELAKPELARWGSTPLSRQFQGGDLPGITARLGYLSELGVETIYLNPIFASPSNHRYDTVDFYQVDPALGGNAALAELVKTAHRHSLRVIIDASFNHVHPRFFAFEDLIARGQKSVYKDWFVVNEWPLRLRYRRAEVGPRSWINEWLPVWSTELGLAIEEVSGPGPALEPTYEAWYGVPTMPRLNLAHPEARRYMLEVATHWVKNYSIDGWRMDVVRYVDFDFWADFRRAVKQVNPDALLLAEVIGDAGPWLQGDRFDATMNYTFRALALGFFARGDLAGDDLLEQATRLVHQYPWSVTLANQNLIGSHDTPRFLTEAGGEVWRLGLATLWQLTFPGSPGIYYGDEVGLAGPNDPGCRGAFPWESDPAIEPVHRLIREVAALRRRRPSLRTGEWRPIEGRGGLVVFERRLGRERTLVGINRGSRLAGFDAGRVVAVRWGAGLAEGRRVTVAPRSAVIGW